MIVPGICSCLYILGIKRPNLLSVEILEWVILTLSVRKECNGQLLFSLALVVKSSTNYNPCTTSTRYFDSVFLTE
jgi:hypothetical protein